MSRTQWTDESIEKAIRTIAEQMGHFPSAVELRSMGANDLCCQLSRRGGMLHWSEKIGFPRLHSDSDTGWEGETAFMTRAENKGFFCDRPRGVKSPFDLLLNGILRVDVKSARYAEYKVKGTEGNLSAGWFYRLGKACQADIVVLYQLDTHAFYAVPWWDCPTGNITITQTGKRYAKYLNNWNLIQELADKRSAERSQISSVSSESPAA